MSKSNFLIKIYSPLLSSWLRERKIAAQIAELSYHAPTDIDPEEFGETFRTHGFDQIDDDGENEKVEKDMGREHYISVGKSKLRHNLLILDDPKYAGKHSNRKDIFYSNDISDSEDIQTIDKWSNKVQIASGIPLNKKFKAINQDVNTQIEQILQDKERLINRTQLKRNLDKILGKKDYDEPNKDIKKHDEHLSNYDVEIFDDTDFYQQLLRELIESRMIDTDETSLNDLRIIG
ncbi:2484_t:CDS:2 [Funneliformis geosporum]|uniref:2484_t:CDS:1 n=1 Tax=Funneliformis geosporum TaxID=1117311 RepID=A0A9W4X214_9GLOM|nr:2484_t:CDS:2 [Funneliformis geosporum]